MPKVLSGDLSFLGLGEIIQLIGSNGGTGVLRMVSKYTPDPGLMYFVKGMVINASVRELKGIDAAYQLFGYTEGEFDFTSEEVKIEKVINKNRMEIILDGLRMVDEGQVEILGPVALEKRLEESAEGTAKHKGPTYPVIRGPLVDYMYVVSEDEFRDGQVIVEENKHGTWNWTILEGIVDIVRQTSKGPLKLIRYGDGAFVGSIDSLSFKGSARHATAVAKGNVQLGVLDSQRLTMEYTQMTQEFKNLISSLEKRLREVTESAVSVYLKKNEMKDILQDAKLVIRQSSSELKQVFNITEGEAYVVQHTDAGFLLLARLGKGDFIGKIPFLDIGHEPLAAAVFASRDFKVTKPDIGALKKEYEDLSPTMQHMIENAATSILMTTRVAYDFQRALSPAEKKGKKKKKKKEK